MASHTRPFLRWVGGKRRLLGEILPHLPPGKRYIEPFLGSGAVWINTDYPECILGDSNLALIDVYRFLREAEDDFIDACARLFIPANNRRDRHCELRSRFNICGDRWERAVLFVYLNRHSYNTKCEFNVKGEFNVDFGTHPDPVRLYEMRMRTYAQRLRGVDLRCQDYSALLREAEGGDVVYCDPPYPGLLSLDAQFRYSPEGFSGEDQVALWMEIEGARRRGARVVVSNRDCPSIRCLYEGAEIHPFSMTSHFRTHTGALGRKSEILAVFS